MHPDAADAQPEVTQMRQPKLDRFRYERLLHRSGLAPNTRYVLCVLAHYTDAKTLTVPARYVPSQKTLAEDTGLSLRTVRRAIDDAEANGWLASQTGRGRGHRAAYTLTVPDDAPGLLRVVDNSPATPEKGGHCDHLSSPKRGHSDHLSSPKRGHSDPLSIKETNSSSNGGGAGPGPGAIVARSLGLAEDDDEVSRIIETITSKHRPANLAGYVTTLAARGDLGKYRGVRACGRPAGAAMSSACLNGNGADCAHDWCGCQHHGNERTRPLADATKGANRDA